MPSLLLSPRPRAVSRKLVRIGDEASKSSELSNPVLWKKYSLPSSPAMKPKPRSDCTFFTVPLGISISSVLPKVGCSSRLSLEKLVAGVDSLGSWVRRRRAAQPEHAHPQRLHHLGERAVRGAEFQRVGFGLGENLAAMLLDGVGEDRPVLDLQSPMVDARAGTGKLRLRGGFAVVDHERKIGLAIGHMP